MLQHIVVSSNFNLSVFFGSKKTNFVVFILNILPLLSLTILRIRYFLIVLFAITPNLLVSIGGAELSGYSTHYHSIYLPILMCLGALSVTNENNSEFLRKKQSIIITFALVFSVLGTYNNARNYNDLGIVSKLRVQAHDGMDALGLISTSKATQRITMKSELAGIFVGLSEKTGKSISAPESFMPILTSMGFGSIDYFPINLGSNDLLVVPYTDVEFTKIEVSFYGLLPIESREIWSQITLDKLNKSYKMLSKKSGGYGHIAIFEKIPSK